MKGLRLLCLLLSQALCGIALHFFLGVFLHFITGADSVPVIFANDFRRIVSLPVTGYLDLDFAQLGLDRLL